MEIHRYKTRLEGSQPEHLDTITHLPLYAEEGVQPCTRETQKPHNNSDSEREETVQEFVIKVTAKYEAK